MAACHGAWGGSAQGVWSGSGALLAKESAEQHKEKPLRLGVRGVLEGRGQGLGVTGGLAVTSGIEVMGEMGQGFLVTEFGGLMFLVVLQVRGDLLLARSSCGLPA